MRYWDAAAIVPLLVGEPRPVEARAPLAEDAGIVTWWRTRVECTSAIARLERAARASSSARDGHQRSTRAKRMEAPIWSQVYDPLGAAVIALVGLLVWLQAGPLAWMVRLPPNPALDSKASTIHYPEGGPR
jgi:hypothetical protein